MIMAASKDEVKGRLPIKGISALQQRYPGQEENSSIVIGTNTGDLEEIHRYSADVSPLMSHKKLPHEIDKVELGKMQSKLI